jgi:CubicO group peptidase (beta-lactamase class C family)
MKLSTFILCALVAGPLAAAEETVAPKVSPEEAQRFKVAADYSEAAHGLSLLVMRDGEILFERYAPIWNADKPHLLGTGTMSFVGVLAACAAHDGLFAFDDKVSDTLVEWKDGGDKERITIRQLLGMCSGIEGINTGNPYPTYRHAVMLAESTAPPGRRFSLGPLPVQCFGELLRRKLAPQNLGVGDYLERRLLAPIGLRVGFWRRDGDNDPLLYSAVFLTAREWAKLGELVRSGGRWKGQQLIRRDLLAACLEPQPGSPAFGLGWWLLSADPIGSVALVEASGRSTEKIVRALGELQSPEDALPEDTFVSMGKGKQRCYIVPSHRLVVVRMGDSGVREFSDHEFFARLLGRPATELR